MGLKPTGKKSGSGRPVSLPVPHRTGERGAITPRSRQAWRAWLQKHHDTASGVWLHFAKKASGLPTVSYNDAVEEALCFGWIDGVRHPVDTTYYRQWFAPRKPRSSWAPSNKARVKQLIEGGAMTAAGLVAIAVAKANGSWAMFDAAERLHVPRELQQALDANALAKQHWRAFTVSQRRSYLYWLSLAKRDETRVRRVRHIVDLVARGLTPSKAEATRRRRP